MFRIRDPQESLWQSQFLVTPKKAKRLERSWAEVFRNEALPLIDEERFAPMYCVDNGRPNRAVQTVLGVHLLKEMFNLTDDEVLEQLEFNLFWHHALRLDIEETHLPLDASVLSTVHVSPQRGTRTPSERQLNRQFPGSSTSQHNHSIELTLAEVIVTKASRLASSAFRKRFFGRFRTNPNRCR